MAMWTYWAVTSVLLPAHDAVDTFEVIWEHQPRHGFRDSVSGAALAGSQTNMSDFCAIPPLEPGHRAHRGDQTLPCLTSDTVRTPIEFARLRQQLLSVAADQ